MKTRIEGFSRLSRDEKVRLAAEFASNPEEFAREIFANRFTQNGNQVADYTENAISDFRLPYSVAPNFLINGKLFMVPMVTEESSVVAAAASAAKFWLDRGGFVAGIENTIKPGHIHFIWHGLTDELNQFFEEIADELYRSVDNLTASMSTRGGGIVGIKLVDLTAVIDSYFQVEVLFKTADAMGANFINSCLESMAECLVSQAEIKGHAGQVEIIMAILSNYTPQCLAKCKVSCRYDELIFNGIPIRGRDFARKFELAVQIAHNDISRAVTNNKGIFNGVDAVMLATGNDFRAVESAGHSWASRSGRYRGLSEVKLTEEQFELSLVLPLPVGVTGGLTNLHPLVRASLRLLGNPDAETLMTIAISAGMANHFSAIRALITEGIQRGHMRMHLNNILNQLNAGENEKMAAFRHFAGRKISFAGVRDFLSQYNPGG